MINTSKLMVSHAPFWHNGDSICKMNMHIFFALLPAALFGINLYGLSAIGVLCLSVASAMVWELAFNLITGQKISIGDLNAAVIGMVFGMMLPATAPWWAVLAGTFVSIVIAKMIFGGHGANPFHPALVGMAFLMLSWKVLFNFDAAYVNYDFPFTALAPLPAVRFMGPEALEGLFPASSLIMGQQVGSIGGVFGLGLMIGEGYIRWEIPVSFIAGIVLTSYLFHLANPDQYAGPVIHLFSGYTLLAAFFIITEHSSSPVNTIPMLIYGFAGGVIIMLMRSIGVYEDGIVFGVLLMNLIVVLTVLTAVSGGLLASVKSGTQEKIEYQIFTYQLAPAMNEIFGEVANKPAEEKFEITGKDGVVYKFFPAKLQDGSTAVAFETKGKGGYGGDVGLMVGINLDTDKIVQVRVTTHSETPGLGAKAKDDPEFVSQFSGLPVDTNMGLTNEGGVINAMSGASITSKAVTLAATQAQDIYKKLKPEMLTHIK